MTAPAELRRVRRQRLAATVHRLGARAIFELFDEIAREHGIGDDIDRRLAGYAGRLRAQMLLSTGGDGFPASPMRALEGGR